MNDMNKRLSEIGYYMKPEKYENRPDDNNGPETREIIVSQLNAEPLDIFLIGDSEEGFDCDHWEILDEFIGYGGFKERNERYDEEYDTELVETLYETKYGNICVVEGRTVHGTLSIYFATKITRNNLEIAINNVKSGLSAEPRGPIQITVKPEILDLLAKMLMLPVDAVEAKINEDFEVIAREFYGIKI